MNGISILLVDDHPVVREGYRRILDRQPGFAVCAEAADAAGAYQAYKDKKPDIVIMDLGLQGASGVEALRRIREWDKDARVLVFTMHQGAAYALKAFEAGASGYITKGNEPGELIKAVDIVARGGRYVSDDVSKAIAANALSGGARIIDSLGPRETEILRLIASGLSSEEVAEILHLSHKTVRNHHYAIKRKIGARNDAHLVWLAVKAGLLENDFVNRPVDLQGE